MWPISDKLQKIYLVKTLRNIAFLLISINFGQSLAQINSDTLMIQDMMAEAYFYDKASESYLPLVDPSQFQGKAIHFRLEEKLHQGLLLRVSGGGKFSIFIDKKLVRLLKPGVDLSWPTDDLFSKYGNAIEITFYSDGLDCENISANLFSVVETVEGQLSENEVIILQQRKNAAAFNNFLIVGLLVLGLSSATLYNYYPRVTADFFKFERAVAFREIDENLLKSRPFNRVNILFYLLFCLLSGLLLVATFVLSQFSIAIKVDSTPALIWLWLRTSGIILVWLIIKYLMVRNFTSLFNVKGFLPSHFFNYIRLGFFIFTASLVVTAIAYIGFEITNPDYYKTLFTMLLIAVAMRTLLIMFKLMNSASYKFLHLFSYLCGTEIIPLGIILFLGFNQPF